MTNISRFASRFLLLGLLGLFIVFYTVTQPGVFLTVGNLQSIASNNSVLMAITLAELFPLVAGVFDLSIGGGISLALVLVAGLTAHQHLPVYLAVILTLSAGVVIGLINGFIVTVLKVNAFIGTLAIGLLLGGVADWYTGSEVISSGVPTSWSTFGNSKILGIPSMVLIVIGLLLAAWVLLEHTALGRRIRATGASVDAARLSGLRVERYQVFTFVMSGLLTATAALLELASVGSADPGIGDSFLLPAFAGVFLGATAITIGRFNVWGTAVAVMTIAVGVAGLELFGAPYYVSYLFNGGVLIIAVALTEKLRRDRAVKGAAQSRQNDDVLEHIGVGAQGDPLRSSVAGVGAEESK